MLCIDKNDLFLRKDFFTCDESKGVSLSALIKKFAPTPVVNNDGNATSHYFKLGANGTLKSILLSDTIIHPVKFDSTESIAVSFDTNSNTFTFDLVGGAGLEASLTVQDEDGHSEKLVLNDPLNSAVLTFGQGTMIVPTYNPATNKIKFDFNPGGTLADYVTGAGTRATFPTQITAFTNNAGYITSSALTPYLQSSVAATTYFPLLGGTITGTAGSGFIGLPSQNTNPTAESGITKIYADSTGRFSWITGLGFRRTFTSTSLTADRVYTLKDANGTLAFTSDIPTTVSSFTNDSGYITSSALSPYLTSSTAASTYFPLTGGSITGTGGLGFFGAIAQASTPFAPASGFRLFADSSGRFSWVATNGLVRTFDATGNTTNRSYTLPDYDGTFILYGNTNTLGSNSLSLSTTNTGSGNTFFNLTNGSAVNVFRVFADGTLSQAQSRTGLTTSTTISSFSTTIGITDSNNVVSKIIAYSIDPTITGTGYTNKTIVGLSINPNSRGTVNTSTNRVRALEVFLGNSTNSLTPDEVSFYAGSSSVKIISSGGSRADLTFNTNDTTQIAQFFHQGSGTTNGMIIRSITGNYGVILQTNLSSTNNTNILTFQNGQTGFLNMGSSVSNVNLMGLAVNLGTTASRWTAGSSGTTVTGINWSLPVAYADGTNYSTSAICLLGDFDITEIGTPSARAAYYGFRFRNTRFMSGLNLGNTAPAAVLDLGQHADTTIPTLKIAESNTTAPSNTSTPTAWCRIVVNGTTYKMPLYS